MPSQSMLPSEGSDRHRTHRWARFIVSAGHLPRLLAAVQMRTSQAHRLLA
jgi:hypothetical protein